MPGVPIMWRTAGTRLGYLDNWGLRHLVGSSLGLMGCRPQDGLTSSPSGADPRGFCPCVTSAPRLLLLQCDHVHEP